MNDLAFLDEELSSYDGVSDATLKAVLPGGKVVHISDNISPFKFLDTCPLLYHTFEPNSQSRLQASIEASSETAVISLARYCYTGNYLAGEPDGDTIFLLQHAETYKIAEDFNVPELQIMAHGNFSCQIEYACCLPNPPQDLLDTIRFIYRHFATDEARRKHNLVDTLLNYCVAVYLYHKLGESLDFLTAVHEISAFRQDLCRTNIARNFEDDWAAEIIRLPCGSVAEHRRPPTTLSSRDLPREMLYDEPSSTGPAGVASVDTSFADSIPAESGRDPMSSSSFRRRAFDTKRFSCDLPDRSKHNVSPSALTAALETHQATWRKYKRARIDEATERLPRFVFPEAGPSRKWSSTKETGTAFKAEPAPVVEEESYWKGAFGQSETQPHKATTEGKFLFDFGEPNASQAPSSPPAVDAVAVSALLHKLCLPAPVLDADIAADTGSEDEGFAIIQRPQATADTVSQSLLSSPELVPAASAARSVADDEAGNDNDWILISE